MSARTATLPPARHPESPYTLAMVCLGNICRSPTAEVVLSAKLAGSGLTDRVRVISSGTGGWHAGDAMDERASTTLTAAGYDASRHRARQFDAGWFDRADVILAMDHSNLHAVNALAHDDETGDRVLLFREFDPQAGGDLELPDPWFGGMDGFRVVLDIVERTTDELVSQLHAYGR
ncbi:MAG: low molecular weight phosphotyrosine protein phosphatase [Propionibacteriales bacterium]|nr:low molecular weight phosphotyrosine protein phosphatase [Propionibacteriales bacterium]